jgi:hypothetical protein
VAPNRGSRTGWLRVAFPSEGRRLPMNGTGSSRVAVGMVRSTTWLPCFGATVPSIGSTPGQKGSTSRSQGAVKGSKGRRSSCQPTASPSKGSLEGHEVSPARHEPTPSPSQGDLDSLARRPRRHERKAVYPHPHALSHVGKAVALASRAWRTVGNPRSERRYPSRKASVTAAQPRRGTSEPRRPPSSCARCCRESTHRSRYVAVPCSVHAKARVALRAV